MTATRCHSPGSARPTAKRRDERAFFFAIFCRVAGDARRYFSLFLLFAGTDVRRLLSRAGVAPD
jgi:hypothetical protein